MRSLLIPATFVCLALAAQAFAQSSNATVSGTVSDATGALIPGVTITATNTQTGIVSTGLSNESGAYNFASLQPGVYNLSAELPGFQTQTYSAVQLGLSQTLRLNFALQVGAVTQSVEVSVASDTLLAASSASVGGVLPEYRVRDLPTIGRDALELVATTAGVTSWNSNIGTARTSETFAGISAGIGAVNTMRDGVTVSDGRYSLGVFASTNINPDLVGEMRVIVAPADAEMGRGVGQVQILTRSGTNKHGGSAVWNLQNSALDARSWNANRTDTTKTWYNRQQLTASFGGPIKMNRTFFFALVNGQRMNSRQNIITPVLSDQARQGLFRYFPGVQNGNADQLAGGTGNTAIAPSVDVLGNPVRPATATGDLQTVNMFGRDPLRPGYDSTGFIQRWLSHMPSPNDYRSAECIQANSGSACTSTSSTGTSTDGLNIANFRWVRKGDSLIGNQFGTEEDTNRDQINVKIDHQFNSSHKLSGSYTWETQNNVSNPSPWPTGFNGRADREPSVFTSSLVSTLSSNVVNEARWGLRHNVSGNTQPCDLPEVREELYKFLPSANGYPVLVSPAVFGLVMSSGCNSVTSKSPMWTYADTLSWTKGKHAYKGGAEMRLARTEGSSSVNFRPSASGGAGNFPVTGIETAQIPGLIGNNLTRMRNLLLTLSGSLTSVSQSFRANSPTATEFLDMLQVEKPPSRVTVTNEFSAFFKDDWKITPSLTLNLGMRYEWYGVPWEGNGMTASMVGGGFAGFGWSGRSWNDYWAFGPQKGELTEVQFIGPKSPHPDQQLFNDDWNNFAPAVGFSWSLPWFGQDKTTVRGGYGVSYFGQGGRGSSIDSSIGQGPGTIDQQTFTSPSFLNLTNIVLPLAKNKPGLKTPITQRTQSIDGWDPNFVNPYIQSFNFSITRQVRSNVTLDLRYVGTKGTKLYGSLPLNTPNFMTNGLREALDITRAGGDAPLFDQMLRGLNLNPGVAGFGAVGTVVGGVLQTGSAHLRQNTTFRGNIANGNYSGVASSLNSSTAVTGEGGGLIRNGGLPENFIVNNPQFSGVTLTTNPGSSTYHSMQTQVTFRPTSGLSYQLTYVLAKVLGNNGAGVDVLNRQLNRTTQDSDRRHEFKLNGAWELPFGPNRLLLGNSRGVVARLVEQWQVSWLFNANSGQPLDIDVTNTYINGQRAQMVQDFPKNQGKARMTDILPTYFEPGTYTAVADPQCANVTVLQNLRTACTLGALADSQGRIILQTPTPGTLGNLGSNWLTGPGTFRFDMSAQKTVKIGETKSFQIRVDARNVLNKPILGAPNLSLGSAAFGQIAAGGVSGTRNFQAQMRFSF